MTAPACPRATNNGVFTAGTGTGWRNPNFTRSATTSGWATRGHCSTPQRGARKTEPSIVLPVMHASFIVMWVIKGFLVINSDVLPHCLFSPLFFFLACHNNKHSCEMLWNASYRSWHKSCREGFESLPALSDMHLPGAI